jgi:hypothetical protein
VSETPRGLNGRGLSRHYGELDPAERFRLVLAAGACDDHRERDRLVATCPRFGYRMSDAAYLDRVDASRDAALAVVLQLSPQLAQAKMLEVMGELVEGAFRATAELAVALAAPDGTPEKCDPALDAEAEAEAETVPDGTPDEVGDAPIVRTAAGASAQLRSEAAAVYEAFAKVCRDEMGLEPDVVMQAHLGPLHVAMLGLDALDGVKPDKAHLADWHEMFRRKWRERVGG